MAVNLGKYLKYTNCDKGYTSVSRSLKIVVELQTVLLTVVTDSIQNVKGSLILNNAFLLMVFEEVVLWCTSSLFKIHGNNFVQIEKNNNNNKYTDCKSNEFVGPKPISFPNYYI